MLMSDGFGRIKRWDLNHFNDDAHAEEVHFIFIQHQSWTERCFRCCVRRTLLDIVPTVERFSWNYYG